MIEAEIQRRFDIKGDLHSLSANEEVVCHKRCISCKAKWLIEGDGTATSFFS